MEKMKRKHIDITCDEWFVTESLGELVSQYDNLLENGEYGGAHWTAIVEDFEDEPDDSGEWGLPDDTFYFEVVTKKDKKGLPTDSFRLHADPDILEAKGVEKFGPIYGTVIEVDYSTGNATWWKVGLPGVRNTVRIIAK